MGYTPRLGEDDCLVLVALDTTVGDIDHSHIADDDLILDGVHLGDKPLDAVELTLDRDDNGVAILELGELHGLRSNCLMSLVDDRSATVQVVTLTILLGLDAVVLGVRLFDDIQFAPELDEVASVKVRVRGGNDCGFDGLGVSHDVLLVGL
jgi:hypothetical protein